jgi:hypothetical protein
MRRGARRCLPVAPCTLASTGCAHLRAFLDLPAAQGGPCPSDRAHCDAPTPVRARARLPAVSPGPVLHRTRASLRTDAHVGRDGSSTLGLQLRRVGRLSRVTPQVRGGTRPPIRPCSARRRRRGGSLSTRRRGRRRPRPCCTAQLGRRSRPRPRGHSRAGGAPADRPGPAPPPREGAGPRRPRRGASLDLVDVDGGRVDAVGADLLLELLTGGSVRGDLGRTRRPRCVPWRTSS